MLCCYAPVQVPLSRPLIHSSAATTVGTGSSWYQGLTPRRVPASPTSHDIIPTPSLADVRHRDLPQVLDLDKTEIPRSPLPACQCSRNQLPVTYRDKQLVIIPIPPFLPVTLEHQPSTCVTLQFTKSLSLKTFAPFYSSVGHREIHVLARSYSSSETSSDAELNRRPPPCYRDLLQLLSPAITRIPISLFVPVYTNRLPVTGQDDQLLISTTYPTIRFTYTLQHRHASHYPLHPRRSLRPRPNPA